LGVVLVVVGGFWLALYLNYSNSPEQADDDVLDEIDIGAGATVIGESGGRFGSTLYVVVPDGIAPDDAVTFPTEFGPLRIEAVEPFRGFLSVANPVTDGESCSVHVWDRDEVWAEENLPVDAAERLVEGDRLVEVAVGCIS
jgi:hypothetical protein